MKTSPAVCRQFEGCTQHQNNTQSFASDPLYEEEYTQTKGLIHRYDNRALLLVTVNCGAYCQFCTRQRVVSDVSKGLLCKEDIDAIEVYLRTHTEIKEVILSGGDPLTQPYTLRDIIKRINTISTIKVVRVGTRLPVVDPERVNSSVVDILATIQSRPVYLMLHVEHPDELTNDCIKAIQKLQSVTTMVLSQSVFLKGVNDDVDVLEKLFSRLIELGVKPYYIFRCDPVQGAESFSVDLEKEVALMTELHSRLSGIACPLYVVDVPRSKSKIPVPLLHWSCDRSYYTDGEGNIVGQIYK